MGWLEFLAWIRAMNKQVQGEQTPVDSWRGADRDGWWVEQRRAREEMQRH